MWSFFFSFFLSLKASRITSLGHSEISSWYVFCFCFFFKKFTFFYLFIYDCVESSFLCEGFLQLRRVGTTLHRSARASHRRGLSCCGAQAPDAQAQQLWLTGPVAPWHVGSSQTGARTRVPCIGRQTLNHCATREAPICFWVAVFKIYCIGHSIWSFLKKKWDVITHTIILH